MKAIFDAIHNRILEHILVSRSMLKAL